MQEGGIQLGRVKNPVGEKLLAGLVKLTDKNGGLVDL